jgi:hypothetical protein
MLSQWVGGVDNKFDAPSTLGSKRQANDPEEIKRIEINWRPQGDVNRTAREFAEALLAA